MSRVVIVLSCLLISLSVFIIDHVQAAGRPRVIVSTDIGGSDPDDFQSMVHYLVYADQFDTEGLVSSPPKAGRVKDIYECLEAYERDYPNLRSWSADYPTAAALRQVVHQGATIPQQGEEPANAASSGARHIIRRARADDDRPLYVLVWGSITDVAQAVHHNPDIKNKLRVYSIGSWNTRMDPKARDYLFNNHPDIWWIESDTTFRGMYMGGIQKKDLGNRTFPRRHVQGHGHLGQLFMRKKADIKMGDTPSVLYLLHGEPNRPESEHWGGSFVQPLPKKRPRYWHDDPAESLAVGNKRGAKTVSKWREDYLRDWEEHMDRVEQRRE